MKNLILLFVFLLGSFISFGQSEKTLIKSFQVNVSDVSFDFESKKVVQSWDKNYVRIELLVKTNFKYEILDVLVKNGRYTFDSKIENQSLLISLPNLSNKVKIGDVDLMETFEIKIWLPNETTLKTNVNL